jgi:putative peptidoglycan lipid II flippase
MVSKLVSSGKKLFTHPQTSVLSAATIVMIMILASRVLGLARQRVLADHFAPGDLSLFFAAFRLPDVLFEVLVFGTFSSAFIPVFTKELKSGGTEEAWNLASKVITLGLTFFIVFAVCFSFFAQDIYHIITPGFSENETSQIASVARILFAAQGFFVISYVFTGVLESMRRFLVPAMAPLFYNIGIIIGTILLSNKFGLLGPAIGVVIGAILHFCIQLPLAYKLGFRFTLGWRMDSGVKKIGKLALPRIVDLSFDQIGKTVELSLASLISKASYTYYTFANSLQLLPVSLFGIPLAKAALPMLSRESDNLPEFKRILRSTLFQAIFFTLPLTAIIIVLRIPLVRLAYGTNIFDWESTIQTGYVLSAFGIGIVFQTLMSILTRSFFALHDTKTPVYVSMLGLLLLVVGDAVLVLVFGIPIWALAISFTFSVFVETILLLYLLNKRISGFITTNMIFRIGKMIVASIASSFVMYFVLKLFDRSVWVKQLSFLGQVDISNNINFELFVLDTRYTVNLLVLTLFVMAVGGLTYLIILFVLRSRDLSNFFGILKRISLKNRSILAVQKEQEPMAPVPDNTTS